MSSIWIANGRLSAPQCIISLLPLTSSISCSIVNGGSMQWPLNIPIHLGRWSKHTFSGLPGSLIESEPQGRRLGICIFRELNNHESQDLVARNTWCIQESIKDQLKWVRAIPRWECLSGEPRDAVPTTLPHTEESTDLPQFQRQPHGETPTNTHCN